MRIKNIELEDFIKFLDEMDLFGTASRMRTRFKNLLIEYNTRFNQERLDIIKFHSNLDENGNVKIHYENEVQIPEWKSEEDAKLADQEFLDLCNEEIVIDETEERKDMLLSVKDSLLNKYNVILRGRPADLYHAFCEKFEKVNYGESE